MKAGLGSAEQAIATPKSLLVFLTELAMMRLVTHLVFSCWQSAGYPFQVNGGQPLIHPADSQQPFITVLIGL